jgi:hypothetical protein
MAFSGGYAPLLPGAAQLQAGPATQPLTAALFTNSNALAYGHTLTVGAVTLAAARFDNSNHWPGLITRIGLAGVGQKTYGTAFRTTVTRGDLNRTLTQDATFASSAAYYTHTLTAGAVTLTQTARFDGAATHYQHTLTATKALAQSARFDGSASFYSHVLSATKTLTAALYANAATYYTHTLTQGSAPEQGLTQSARLDGATTYYAHSLSVGATTLTAARYDNAAGFYSHTLSLGDAPEQPLTQALRYDGSAGFYVHALGLRLAQSSPFANSEAFYSHAITIVGPQALTAGRFDNGNAFFGHALTGGQTKRGGRSLLKPLLDAVAVAKTPRAGHSEWGSLTAEADRHVVHAETQALSAFGHGYVGRAQAHTEWNADTIPNGCEGHSQLGRVEVECESVAFARVDPRVDCDVQVTCRNAGQVRYGRVSAKGVINPSDAELLLIIASAVQKRPRPWR